MEILKRAWAEVHLDRLRANVENYQNCLGSETGKTQLMCVVKADCYGHGSPACSLYLQEEAGIRWFAVSNLNEALELRESGITGEILILGYTPPEYAGVLSENNIIQAATDLKYAQELSACADNCAGKPVRVHIKLDTGMSRLGLRFSSPDEYCEQILSIASLENISAEGLFTHLSSADSMDSESVEFTKEQIKLFDSVCDKAQKLCPQLKERHFMNSAGGVFYNNSKATLARLGIIMYGLTPDRELKLPFELHPVMELKAVVSQVKYLEKGASVSYGRTFTAPGRIKTATVAAGYADGVPRLLSNKGEVLIGGKKAPIIGRVCMDQLIADVTGIDVRPGDVAVIIGSDGANTVTADDIAEKCSTIGYEIVCGITKRVPRVYLK